MIAAQDRIAIAAILLITVAYLIAVWRLDDRSSHQIHREAAVANNPAETDQ